MVDKSAGICIIINAETTRPRGFLLFSTNAGDLIAYNSTLYCRAKRPSLGGSKNPASCLSNTGKPIEGCFSFPGQSNQVNKNSQGLDHPGHLIPSN